MRHSNNVSWTIFIWAIGFLSGITLLSLTMAVKAEAHVSEITTVMKVQDKELDNKLNLIQNDITWIRREISEHRKFEEKK